MGRHCDRPSCAALAAVTLSYQYDTGQVWLEHLSVEDHPMTHDLCLDHADNLVVPRGWTLIDHRRDIRNVS